MKTQCNMSHLDGNAGVGGRGEGGGRTAVTGTPSHAVQITGCCENFSAAILSVFFHVKIYILCPVIH